MNNETMSINKFVHFGCWNNLNKKGNLSNVMNSLNNYLENQQDVKLIIVSGDNYYPDKKKIDDDKKKKIIFTDKLIEGFNLLPKNIEIDMILGNHDLENDPTGEELFVNDNGNEYPERGTCEITKLEKIASKQNPNINFNLFKSRMLTPNTLIILIDSSMYYDDNDVNEFLPCYNEFSGIDHGSLENLRNSQNQFIYDTVSQHPNIKNLILVGHHPITGFKTKKGKNKLMNDIPNFYEVLKNVYEITSSNSDIKYYYLCADYHSYQSGKITLNFDDGNKMDIIQYICGTGGTELDDDLNYDDNDKLKRSNVVDRNESLNLTLNYLMIQNVHHNGFLECIIDSEDNFNCNLIMTENTSGGKKRKTRKNKSRKSKKSKKTRRRNKTRRKKQKSKRRK
jgi:hypothetical protein